MSSRIHYLDALRSFAMLFGLFVHANGLFAQEVFPLVGLASEHFRMASFFLVSGFFSSLVAERTSDAAMVSRRTLALMLPFCVMLALVHPVTLYLVHLRHEGFMTFAEFLATRWQPAAFLHLWFLPALWFYVLLAPLLRAVLSLTPLRPPAGSLTRLPGRSTRSTSSTISRSMPSRCCWRPC